jgi:Holliday junction resolvase
MTSAQFVAHVDAAMSEEQFYRQLREVAEAMGWAVHHETDSRRTHEGWPDLVMCRPPRIIFAELKSQKGKMTRAQQRWLDLLAESGGAEVSTYVWRPSDWDTIVEVLT